MEPARRFARAPFALAWRIVRFVAPLAPDAALHRTVWAAAGLFLTMAVGVVGYRLIDGFSAFDALYQTVLTLTTVGFQELHPLSDGARAFTIFLMLFGVGIALYLLTAIATPLLEGDLYRDVDARRQRRMTDQLTGHLVFVGSGRMGTHIIEEAIGPGDAFVVIEEHPASARDARDRGWMVIEDDAEQEAVLRGAGVERAAELFALTGDDATNTFITMRAKQFASSILVTSRCSQPGNEDLMRSAGASEVLSPFEMIARQVAAARASRR